MAPMVTALAGTVLVGLAAGVHIRAAVGAFRHRRHSQRRALFALNRAALDALEGFKKQEWNDCWVERGKQTVRPQEFVKVGFHKPSPVDM